MRASLLPLRDGPLRVLAVLEDNDATSVISIALQTMGDEICVATNVADALSAAETFVPDLALVDVGLESDAALALMHHLPAVCPKVVLHALVKHDRMSLATEALSLGAAGVLPLPINGDAVMRAANDLRTRKLEAMLRAKLEGDLIREQRRRELTDRVVRLANGSGHSESVRAIADAFAELSGAKGVALYATFSSGGGCVRLAAYGSTFDYPSVCAGTDLLRLVDTRKAKAISLLSRSSDLGLVILEEPTEGSEREVEALAELAAAVLAASEVGQPGMNAMKDARGRLYTKAFIEDTAKREIERAKRYGRRASLVVVSVGPDAVVSRGDIDDLVMGAVRNTDIVAAIGEHSLCVLMTETDAMGALACRKRIHTRVGDRYVHLGAALSNRGGPPSSQNPEWPSPLPVWVGVSTFPHDGDSFERLLRTAKTRAQDEADSPLHGLGIGGQSLGEMVNTLLAKPVLDAGLYSPYPIELAAPALNSLVSQVCREARRGGRPRVLVTLQSGLGLAASARHALAADAPGSVQVFDLRDIEGCRDLEAVVVFGEHGTWVCAGRVDRDRFRGVHSADPLLADLVADRLIGLGGVVAG